MSADGGPRSAAGHASPARGVAPAPLHSMIAGAFAGVVGTTLGYPFDTIKARLQSAHGRTSAVACAAKIYREEGARAFYRGMTSPLTALVILNTINFGFYAKTSALTQSLPPLAHSPAQPFVAGGMVGVCAGLVSTPFELAKVRLQLDNQHGRLYRNSWDCARSLVREHGVRALYTGYTVNVVREVVFLSIYFGVYEHMKRRLAGAGGGAGDGAGGDVSAVSIAAAGALSGAAGWFVSFPLDCVKTRVQAMPAAALAERMRAGLLAHGGRYNALRVAAAMLRSHGVRAFYSGVLPSVLRACVVSGSRFSAYEFALHVLAAPS